MSKDSKYKFFQDADKGLTEEQLKAAKEKERKRKEKEYMEKLESGGLEDGGVCSSKKSYFGKLKEKMKKKK